MFGRLPFHTRSARQRRQDDSPDGAFPSAARALATCRVAVPILSRGVLLSLESLDASSAEDAAPPYPDPGAPCC